MLGLQPRNYDRYRRDKKFMTEKSSKIYNTVRPFIYGCITGVVCGAVLSLFLTCAKVTTSFAFGMYSSADTPLAVVCIIMLALLCCLLTAVIQTLNPPCRGSGIPLAEGYARGMLRVKWLSTAASMIAGSLLAFVSGMPVGSEGPSVCIGGLIGDGIGKGVGRKKNNTELRRYLITGGASAGFAVAFNAPLTGVTFALEETHRRFSPGILLAAFSTIVPAILTSQLIFWALGHNEYLYGIGIRSGAAALSYLSQSDYGSVADFFTACGIAAVCGVIIALLAIAFNTCVFALGKLFGKIKSSVLRLMPVFVLSVVCGLCIGTTVGSGEVTLEHSSVNTALWLLFVLLALRFILTVCAGGSGMTGGLFLPMLAIGGIAGTIITKLCIMCGMNDAYAPNTIMLCIAAFFAASVRAPITAIALALELTASFSNLLPVTIAVAIATAISGILRSAPLYERLMENLQREQHVTASVGTVTLCGAVSACSTVCGKRIRDILWPYNSLVTVLMRGNTEIIPDGETILLEGDILTVRAENTEPDRFTEDMREYIDIPIQTEINKATKNRDRT